MLTMPQELATWLHDQLDRAKNERDALERIKPSTPSTAHEHDQALALLNARVTELIISLHGPHTHHTGMKLPLWHQTHRVPLCLTQPQNPNIHSALSPNPD